jgi:hypothetical protein
MAISSVRTMVKLTTLTNHTWTSPSLMQEEELSNEVLSFDIHFLKPDANVAAHLTAKNAIASKYNPICIWSNFEPNFIFASCIQHESNLASE